MELSKVKEILDPFLLEHQLEFYDVELVKEFGYLFLRVYIDKEGGIDLDTLALANEYLSERIEKYDSDMPEYMLEVSSPGCERKLKTYDDILANEGEYVHVEVENMIYEGVMIAVNEEFITLRINAKGRFKNVNVLHTEIKLIRLCVKI